MYLSKREKFQPGLPRDSMAGEVRSVRGMGEESERKAGGHTIIFGF